MNDINIRSEHISRYQAKLKHLDDLLERARRHQVEEAEHQAELKELAAKREELVQHISDMENWQEQEIEQAGPMAIWDAIAQQAEKLVERLEKK